jgi:LuxR family maltose regulon positive regulatory protein
MDDGPPPRSGTGVLRTKLHVPPPPHAHVDRPRLDDAAPTRRLTLVSAPAGFGKSVLVADWCRGSGGPTAWISLDAGDDDPARFWRHLAAAIDTATGPNRTGVQDVVARLVVDGAPPTPRDVMTTVVNAVEAADIDLVLVLDDYHSVSDQRVHDSVRFLLDHGPARLHTVLVTRADPPLPLARLRARGQLTEVRADDLRFRGTEAADVLRSTAGHDLPDEAVRALERRTEGWAAGLQLAGLSLASRDDVEDFVAAFSGTNRFVLDFLSEEVLERQPADVRDFLVTTSALEVLSGPLCDAVTGRDDGQQLLESIERSNLFLVPLDDVRGSWRYHHLFADLLRVRLAQRPAAEVAGLHRRAAAWFEQEGFPDEAVHHALAGGDADAARRTVERHADELLLRREGTTVQRWFEALPDDGASSRRLLLARARVELYRGRVVEAGALLDEAEQAGLAEPPDEPTFEPTAGRGASPLATLGPTAKLLRAFEAHLLGRADDQLRAARAALAELGEDGPTAPVLIARWHLATGPWLLGDVATAAPALADNVEAWRRAGQHERAAWAAHTLGRIQRAAGRPAAAATTYREVLARDADDDVRPPAAAVAHHGLAELAYEQDDLAAARAHADAAIERCRGFVHSESLAAALGVLARIHAAEGDPDGARALFEDAVGLGPEGDVVELLDPTPARRATQLLRDGDPAGAAAWVQDRGLSVVEPSHAREPGLLVLARLLLARGRPEEAAPLLDALAAAADRDGRFGSLVEIEVLRARCLAALDDEAAAITILARAIELAAPQAATRTFVDEPGIGPLLGRLVGASTSDGPLVSDPGAVQHLRRLTSAFDERLLGVSSREVDEVPGMVVPLTEREREVLGLVAEGLRNRDICDRLFISMNTTKTHVSRVISKLGVDNRTAAAQRARDLGLLGP